LMCWVKQDGESILAVLCDDEKQPPFQEAASLVQFTFGLSSTGDIAYEYSYDTVTRWEREVRAALDTAGGRFSELAPSLNILKATAKQTQAMGLGWNRRQLARSACFALALTAALAKNFPSAAKGGQLFDYAVAANRALRLNCKPCDALVPYRVRSRSPSPRGVEHNISLSTDEEPEAVKKEVPASPSREVRRRAARKSPAAAEAPRGTHPSTDEEPEAARGVRDPAYNAAARFAFKRAAVRRPLARRPCPDQESCSRRSVSPVSDNEAPARIRLLPREAPSTATSSTRPPSSTAASTGAASTRAAPTRAASSRSVSRRAASKRKRSMRSASTRSSKPALRRRKKHGGGSSPALMPSPGPSRSRRRSGGGGGGGDEPVVTKLRVHGTTLDERATLDDMLQVFRTSFGSGALVKQEELEEDEVQKLEYPQIKLLCNLRRGAWKFDPSQAEWAWESQKHLAKDVPVSKLRFTHDVVNEKFLHGRHSGALVSQLTDDLSEGKLNADDVQALVVVLLHGCHWVVFGNRRLKAMKDFDDKRSTASSAKCIVYDVNKGAIPHPIFAKLVLSMTTKNEGLGVAMRSTATWPPRAAKRKPKPGRQTPLPVIGRAPPLPMLRLPQVGAR